MNDPASKGPLLLFSTEGGMDIEDVAAEHPDKLVRLPIDIRRGVDAAAVADAIGGLGLGDRLQPVATTLAKLYEVYADNDAELVEINPLIVTADGAVVARACKFTLDEIGRAHV